MAEETLTLKIEEYRCEPCSAKQGTVVRELVRMIPASVVLMGKLVGDEYFCCPICYEPKFTVKGRRPVNAKNQSRAAAGGAGKRAGPVLVAD